MKLKFARFDSQIDLEAGHVEVLEIHERHLFTRIVSSLKSEKGEKAVEPYFLIDNEKSVSPKGRLQLLDALPDLPTHDKGLEKLLYQRLVSEALESTDMMGLDKELAMLGAKINERIRAQSLTLWGTYDFMSSWDFATYLKAFPFGVEEYDDETFLEKCIHYLDLCVDISFKKPHIAINLKSFLSEDELCTLYEQVKFHGIALLLIESWCDSRLFDGERKTCIEQGFLEK